MGKCFNLHLHFSPPQEAKVFEMAQQSRRGLAKQLQYHTVAAPRSSSIYPSLEDSQVASIYNIDQHHICSDRY